MAADPSRVPLVQTHIGDASRGLQVQKSSRVAADPSRSQPIELDTTLLDPSRFPRYQTGTGDVSRVQKYKSAN